MPLRLFAIGVGLSMDAFAVSVCLGLNMHRFSFAHAARAGLYFGGFQALMPLVGWALGSGFSRYIEPVDHWAAFLLLLLIGAKMCYDGAHTANCGVVVVDVNVVDFTQS